MDERGEYFELVRKRLEATIGTQARWTVRYKLHWMDQSEVESWLTYELWRACQTYDSTKVDDNMTIEKYWWRLWINRRSKLARTFYSHNAQLMATAVPVEVTAEDGGTISHPALTVVDSVGVVPCPVPGTLESRVWRMLAHGFNQAEIVSMLNISRTAMKGIMESFRAPEVKRFITSDGVLDHVAQQRRIG